MFVSKSVTGKPKLFNFKAKALEAEVLGSRHNSGVQRPQMHKISVHGTDNRERDPQ